MNQEGRAEDIDYNVAVLVHRSPQMLPLPLDVQEQFVQMPCVAQRATSAVLTQPGLCRSAPRGRIPGPAYDGMSRRVSLVDRHSARPVSWCRVVTAGSKYNFTGDAKPPARLAAYVTRASLGLLANSARRRATDPAVVGQTPTLPSAFHPDLRVVAQLGGTLVRGADEQTAPPRVASERAKLGSCHLGVPRHQHCRRQAVRLVEKRRRDSGEHRAVRTTHPGSA